MDLETIKKQYCDECLSLQAIGDKHGVPRQAIAKIIKDSRWVRRGSVYTHILKPTKAQLMNDYSHSSIEQIEAKYRARDSIIVRWLNEYGIERKPRYLRRPYLKITDFQKEFILGSLLGDMSIVKKGPQYRLSMTHNESQRDYIEHKKMILGELSLANIQDTISKEHKSKIYMNGQFQEHVIKESHGCLLHSKVHPYFTELRNRLYPNNIKTISEWWLNQLTPISLAYWFMDDGCADYSGNCYTIMIATYSCSYDEHVLLQQYLHNKFNIDIQIQSLPHRGCGFTTRLRTGDSKKFRDLIAPYIIPSMQYKVDKNIWKNKKLVGSTN